MSYGRVGGPTPGQMMEMAGTGGGWPRDEYDDDEGDNNYGYAYDDPPRYIDEHVIPDDAPRAVYHNHRQQQQQWTPQQQQAQSPSSSSSPVISTLTASARRRSSAAHGPPPPPPSAPIPALPPVPTTSHTRNSTAVPSSSHPHQRPTGSAILSNGTSYAQHSQQSQYAQPNYAADHQPSSQSQLPHLNDSPPRSILRTDMPRTPAPANMAQNNARQAQQQQQRNPPPQQNHQEIVPGRLLLSPGDARTPPAGTRPSSRRTLTRALELAREAVQLDSRMDDPHGAIAAYGRSVALLSEVMERVMAGENTERRRPSGRRASVAAQEDEIRRLKSIHDTYADRMHILSMIYSIAPVPPSPTSAYGALSSNPNSMYSTRSNTPSGSSPVIEGAELNGSHPYANSMYSDSDAGMSGTESADEGDMPDTVTVPMFAAPPVNGHVNGSTRSVQASPRRPSAASAASYTSNGGLTTPTTAHPFAARQQAIAGSPQSNRTSALPPRLPQPMGPPPSRPRGDSTLPPRVPPPQDALPPPPPFQSDLPSQPLPPPPTQAPPLGRTRSGSISQSRPARTRLDSLTEESERPGPSAPAVPPASTIRRQRSRSIVGQAGPPPENLPLPPVPIPAAPAPAAPLNTSPQYATQPSSDPYYSPVSATPRPLARLGSAASLQSTGSSSGVQPPRDPRDAPLPPPPLSEVPLIMPNTTQGTIFIRRNKTSTSPLAPSFGQPELSPTDSHASTSSSSASGPSAPNNYVVPPLPSLPPGAAPPRLVAAGVSANTAQSLGLTGGRSRSSSLSQRRPSVGGPPPPPVPPSAGGRKMSSATSRFGSYGPGTPGPLSVVTSLPPGSPTTPGPGGLVTLQPPAELRLGQVPPTPSSALPPPPPNESLRKPYHMMALLRATMSSRSGGYITRRLHVPQEVWSQGGVKLSALPEKARVLEVLALSLEDMTRISKASFGMIGVAPVEEPNKNLMGEWCGKLDAFSGECDQLVAAFGKKLGVGEGIAVKRSTFGKIAYQVNKFTNTKNMDSPTQYVALLQNLFDICQILDQHTAAILTPSTLPYSRFSPAERERAENRLRLTSEFFARVVLTFVVRDLSLLLDKYVKKCEKWLAE